jgi:hypothetical protein
MTTNETETGTMGAPTPMTEYEAREITATIRSRVEEVWDLVVLAFQRRADLALGYDSWDDYCAAEFATTQIRIPAADRPEVVLSLAAQGLSTRAIAAATGMSPGTVRRDLTAAEAAQAEASPAAATTPRPTVTGLDGKRYPANRTSPAPHRNRRNGREEPGTSAPVRPATRTWEGLAVGLEKFLEGPEDAAALTPDQRHRILRAVRQVADLVRAANLPAD